MRNNKPKKNTQKQQQIDEKESQKPKKKMLPNEPKVNLKSNKFWEEIIDDEAEDLEKYL